MYRFNNRTFSDLFCIYTGTDNIADVLHSQNINNKEQMYFF